LTGPTKSVSQVWVRQLADPCRTVPKEWADALEPEEKHAPLRK